MKQQAPQGRQKFCKLSPLRGLRVVKCSQPVARATGRVLMSLRDRCLANQPRSGGSPVPGAQAPGLEGQ